VKTQGQIFQWVATCADAADAAFPFFTGGGRGGEARSAEFGEKSTERENGKRGRPDTTKNANCRRGSSTYRHSDPALAASRASGRHTVTPRTCRGPAATAPQCRPQPPTRRKPTPHPPKHMAPATSHAVPRVARFKETPLRGLLAGGGDGGDRFSPLRVIYVLDLRGEGATGGAIAVYFPIWAP
jgi:hypothetical protein